MGSGTRSRGRTARKGMSPNTWHRRRNGKTTWPCWGGGGCERPVEDRHRYRVRRRGCGARYREARPRRRSRAPPCAPQAALRQHRVVEVVAVHRHQRRPARLQRQARRRASASVDLPAPGAGDGDEEAAAPAGRRAGRPRARRGRHAAIASSGGSLAPVMKATASDIV